MNQFDLEALRRGIVTPAVAGTQRTRMAGQSLGRFLPRAAGAGMALGVGLPIGAEVLSQLSREDSPGDAQGNLVRNASGATGGLAGGLGGAMIGAKLGSVVPVVGTAIGAGLGAWAGSAGLGNAARGVAGQVFDASRGTPEDRALTQQLRSEGRIREAEIGYAQQAMPLVMQQQELQNAFLRQQLNDQAAVASRLGFQNSLLNAATGQSAMPVPLQLDPGFAASLANIGRIG
jgi:phage tail tape-measure protein